MQFKLVKVNLSQFFKDHRKSAVIRVNPDWKLVNDLQKHVSKLFSLPLVNFLDADGNFVPDMESIEIFTVLDSIKAFKHNPQERVSEMVDSPASVSLQKNETEETEQASCEPTQKILKKNSKLDAPFFSPQATNAETPKLPVVAPAENVGCNVNDTIAEQPVAGGKRKKITTKPIFSNLISSTPQTAKRGRCDLDIRELTESAEKSPIAKGKEETIAGANVEQESEGTGEHKTKKKRRQRIRKRKSQKSIQESTEVSEETSSAIKIAKTSQHIYFNDDGDSNTPKREPKVIWEMRSPMRESKSKKIRKFTVVAPKASVETGVVITEHIIIPSPNTQNSSGVGSIDSNTSKPQPNEDTNNMGISLGNVSKENHCPNNGEPVEKSNEKPSFCAEGSISKEVKESQNEMKSSTEKTLQMEGNDLAEEQNTEVECSVAKSKENIKINSALQENSKDVIKDISMQTERGNTVDISQHDVRTFNGTTISADKSKEINNTGNQSLDTSANTSKDNVNETAQSEKGPASVSQEVHSGNLSNITADISTVANSTIEKENTSVPTNTEPDKSCGEPISVRITTTDPDRSDELVDFTMEEESSINKMEIGENTCSSIDLADDESHDATNEKSTVQTVDLDDSENESDEVIDLSDEDDDKPSGSRRKSRRSSKRSVSFNEKTVAQQIAKHGIEHVMNYSTKLSDLPAVDDILLFKINNPNRKSKTITNFLAGTCTGVNKRLKKLNILLIGNQPEIENIPPYHFSAIDDSTSDDARSLFIKYDDLIEPHVIKGDEA